MIDDWYLISLSKKSINNYIIDDMNFNCMIYVISQNWLKSQILCYYIIFVILILVINHEKLKENNIY